MSLWLALEEQPHSQKQNLLATYIVAYVPEWVFFPNRKNQKFFMFSIPLWKRNHATLKSGLVYVQYVISFCAWPWCKYVNPCIPLQNNGTVHPSYIYQLSSEKKTLHYHAAMFNPLYSNINLQLFENNLCNQSSYYQNYGWFHYKWKPCHIINTFCGE